VFVKFFRCVEYGIQLRESARMMSRRKEEKEQKMR